MTISEASKIIPIFAADVFMYALVNYIFSDKQSVSRWFFYIKQTFLLFGIILLAIR